MIPKHVYPPPLTKDLPNTSTNVPEYSTSLFSRSNTVTLVISLAASGARATKFRTVAEAEALGMKGEEMMIR